MHSLDGFGPRFNFLIPKVGRVNHFSFSAAKMLSNDLVKKVSDVSFKTFQSIKEGFSYLTAAVPIVMSLVAAASLQKNIINLYQAININSPKDVKRYCLDTLRDVFNLISYLTAAIETLGSSLKTLSRSTLSLVNVISCSFGIIVDSIHLVRQAVHLYASYKVSKMIDRILQDKDMNAKEKVYHILKNLEEQFKEREKVNLGVIERKPANYSERVQNFLDEQMKVEISAVLGEEAYEKIYSSISILRESNEDIDEIFYKTVSELRDAHQIIGLKIRQHWTEIAMDVVSIAAQALCIAMPHVGFPVYIVYTLWTSYGVMFIANKQVDWVEKKKYTQPDMFSQGVLITKNYTKKELNKVYEVLKKRIHAVMKYSKDSLIEKINRLAHVILDKSRLKEFKNFFTLQMQFEIKEKMVKLLHQVAFPKMIDLSDISFINLRELKKVHQQNAKLFESSPLLKEEWNKIKQRIAIMEESLDQLFSKSLLGVVRKLESQKS